MNNNKKRLYIIENENSLETLAEIQKSSSKIVLAGGVFDIIHPGHINTLNAAKKLGDFLVVVIATDKTAVKMKKREPLHSAQLRQELVSSLSMVDLCIVGDEEDILFENKGPDRKEVLWPDLSDRGVTHLAPPTTNKRLRPLFC